MKFAATIIALYAAAAFAAARGPAEDIEAVEEIDPVEDMEPFDDEEPFDDDEPFDGGELFDDLEPFNSTAWDEDDYAEDVFGLEKRRGCTGHRKTTDVCQGKFIAKMNSRHNCYRASGHCCARNKNRDGGIAISNQSKHGEDCMYCFSGRCKGGA